MNQAERTASIAFPIMILLGIGIAWAGSQGSVPAFGIPLFALLIAIIYLIQWLVFIPAFVRQTEKYFDLTGSLTYISISIIAVFLSPERNGRSILLLILVVIWAARLGTFLFRRIQRDGKDGRFDDIKPSFIRYLNTWTIQAAWVTFTLAAALVAFTSANSKALDIFAWIGLLVWAIGFAIEVIADNQKSQFKANSDNKGKFINTGLWARSRHPNYFGEIVLWIGITIIALPVLQGWQWIALISPIFVTLLLTRVSGIPMLEKRADDKWGGQEAYEAYKKQTPVLIPRL